VPLRPVGLEGNGPRLGEIGVRSGVRVVDDRFVVEPSLDLRAYDQQRTLFLSFGLRILSSSSPLSSHEKVDLFASGSKGGARKRASLFIPELALG